MVDHDARATNAHADVPPFLIQSQLQPGRPAQGSTHSWMREGSQRRVSGQDLNCPVLFLGVAWRRPASERRFDLKNLCLRNCP